ncbi:MAG: SDR family NAD(P)-dependent oxidoreductase [Acidobacteria bacterium]|nr:SDR family NAD(P)-dependent oxidoreductase [Acidobacteriota bacterium]
MENEKPLKGKLTLITGVGRSAGIGAAICRELAMHGGDIFFAYWRPYDLEMGYSDNSQDEPAKIAAELRKLGVRVESMAIDLALPDSAERLFEAAEDRLGTPSILVNNACHDLEVPFVELSPEILDQHYAVNVRAVAMLCKEFVKRAKPGRIVNMTSGQSLGSMGIRKVPYSITIEDCGVIEAEVRGQLSPPAESSRRKDTIVHPWPHSNVMLQSLTY